MRRVLTWRLLSATLAAITAFGCGWAPAGPGVAASRGPEVVEAKREIISRTVGDCPNFAQLSDGSMMTVVSRDYGRGAKAGALVELFYPHYATDHLWDAYVGVSAGGKRHWAHELALVGQTIAPDTGLVKSAFRGEGYELVLEDVLPPGRHVHLRRATITNRSASPIQSPALQFHGFFTLNTLPGGDALRYDKASGAMIQQDKGVAVAVVADRLPSDWQCGLANNPLGARRDARFAAEAGEWSRTTEAGPVPTGVTMGLEHGLSTIAPGASASLTYAIAIDGAPARAVAEAKAALAAGFEAGRQADADRWGRWLARARVPAGLPEAAVGPYRRALVTLKQLLADNGAVIAAPTNTSPPYRFVWLRDGALITQALTSAGYPEAAEAFYGFAEKLQQPAGGWAVNYFPDASRPLWDFGTAGNEHDQPGFFAWGIAHTFEATHDQAWLNGRWPAVKKACEFLISQQRPDGLLTTCRDLWELDTDGTWTFSNAAGWAGLDAGAAIARRLGATAEAERYAAAAAKLKAAIREKLVVNGYFARGLRKKGLDPTVEAANLALGTGGFGMLPDADATLAATGRAVSDRLTAGWGGIRRYENDPYYDGQPWPVATGWLALHRSALGDQAGAEKLFATMTRYAHETDALMLGEQYDERTRHWVSAFPLAWSEASYVQTALNLFK